MAMPIDEIGGDGDGGDGAPGRHLCAASRTPDLCLSMPTVHAREVGSFLLFSPFPMSGAGAGGAGRPHLELFDESNFSRTRACTC
eukprot:JP448153.1.p1 GENE.JP448153.1~~JP448153.1.p1  ORF type:complete len:85 (+),score=7.76 JP448153.1:187-441(+)